MTTGRPLGACWHDGLQPTVRVSNDSAPSLAALRASADADCRRRLAEISLLASRLAKAMQAGKSAYAAGAPFCSEPVQRAMALADDAASLVELAAFVVVKGAVVSGRWPEDREDEAHALCADEEGLRAFRDAMAKVPIGFVDPREAVEVAQ